MRDRELLIIREILTALDKMDGAQATESLLHAAISLNLEPSPSMSEFEAALRACDSEKWVTGIMSKITRKMKWSLNDQGKAALAEL